MTSLDDIVRRLEKLARRRGAAEIFGVKSRKFGHRFERQQVRRAEVSELEETLGIVFPAEYRDLLEVIGPKTGPYYGMYSPKEILEEIGFQDRKTV